MNGFIMHFVSGDAFFSGIFFLLVSVVMSFHKSAACGESGAGPVKRTVCRSVLRLSFLVGIMLVAMSSTPLPRVVSILLYLFPAALMVSLYLSVPRRFVLMLGAMSLATCAMSVVVEIPYHTLNPLSRGQYDKVYVVGDSVSAGIGIKGERTWPEIVADECHVEIANLSQGGGTSGSAIRQANLIKDQKALVFLEIGGNDMLGRTPLPEYRADLDHLLEAVKGPERILIMMEIPWAPFHGAFCRAQREMAEKHGARLIPRRIFAGVLEGKDSTVDGIHLSNQGHEKMAEAFIEICGKMLRAYPQVAPASGANAMRGVIHGQALKAQE